MLNFDPNFRSPFWIFQRYIIPCLYLTQNFDFQLLNHIFMDPKLEASINIRASFAYLFRMSEHLTSLHNYIGSLNPIYIRLHVDKTPCFSWKSGLRNFQLEFLRLTGFKIFPMISCVLLFILIYCLIVHFLMVVQLQKYIIFCISFIYNQVNTFKIEQSSNNIEIILFWKGS